MNGTPTATFPAQGQSVGIAWGRGLQLTDEVELQNVQGSHVVEASQVNKNGGEFELAWKKGGEPIVDGMRQLSKLRGSHYVPGEDMIMLFRNQVPTATISRGGIEARLVPVLDETLRAARFLRRV